MNQGIRFKNAREFLGLSQTEASIKIGISQNSVSKMELGKTAKPNVKYLMFLKSEGINTEWLISGNGEMLNKNTTFEEKESSKWKDRALKAEAEISNLKDTVSELRKKINTLYEHLITKDLKIEGLELGKGKASSKKATLPTNEELNLFSLNFGE
ncbi:helix-turn-helix transcriptional regulator [Bernardetia sp. ABR2-2B]|uniref:helix-turn-helix domain-containing protein n=1 Tax=Bernardetia sp. ABR2-2B TaxID=3127472 RepID=UPI0030CE43BE